MTREAVARHYQQSMESPAAGQPDAWLRAVRGLRATGWWYFAALPLVGVVTESTRLERALARSLLGVPVAACCLAFAYGVNGITDRAMDGDATKNSLAGSLEVPREAPIVVAAAAFAGMLLAFPLGPATLICVACSLLAGMVYSAPPRLKRFPVIGTLTNIAIFAPLPFLARSGPPSPSEWMLGYCFCILLAQSQLLHEVADATEDAIGGVRTTGVVLGNEGMRISAFFLGPLCAVPLLFTDVPFPRAATIFAALTLVVGSAWMLFSTLERAARLRVGHRWCSLACGVTLFLLLAAART